VLGTSRRVPATGGMRPESGLTGNDGAHDIMIRHREEWDCTPALVGFPPCVHSHAAATVLGEPLESFISMG
jgi:hypothetical protein